MHTNIQRSALPQLRSLPQLTYLQGIGVASSVGPGAAHLLAEEIETAVQER